MSFDVHDHEDIKKIKRPIFTNYKKMSMSDRAAQFAPFAALTGHKEAVDEKARITENRRVLDENQKDLINNNLLLILDMIDSQPLVRINYFVRDKKKIGGHYYVSMKNVTKIDKLNSRIEFSDGSHLFLDDIYFIDIVKG